jgi:hypothetical protein
MATVSRRFAGPDLRTRSATLEPVIAQTWGRSSRASRCPALMRRACPADGHASRSPLGRGRGESSAPPTDRAWPRRGSLARGRLETAAASLMPRPLTCSSNQHRSGCSPLWSPGVPIRSRLPSTRVPAFGEASSLRHLNQVSYTAPCSRDRPFHTAPNSLHRPRQQRLETTHEAQRLHPASSCRVNEGATANRLHVLNPRHGSRSRHD